MSLDQKSMKGDSSIESQSIKLEEEEEERNRAIAKYTCFTGVFNDGFCVSYSAQPVKPIMPKKATPAPTTPRVISNEPSTETAPPPPPPTVDPKKGASKKGARKEATPEPTVINTSSF